MIGVNKVVKISENNGNLKIGQEWIKQPLTLDHMDHWGLSLLGYSYSGNTSLPVTKEIYCHVKYVEFY